MPSHIGDWDGPGTSFTINGAVAYVDFIALFCRRPLPRDEMRWLRTRYGKRLIPEEIVIPDHPHLWRARVTLHQPDIKTLQLLDEIQSGRFVLHAVHLATDFLVAIAQQAPLATSYLRRGLLLKWRGLEQLSSQYGNTNYGKHDPRSPRNYALYGDKPSKVRGAGACAHLELRFTGAAACKRAGVGYFTNLIQGVDVMALLERQAKIAFIDQSRLQRGLEIFARNTVRRFGGRSTHTVELGDGTPEPPCSRTSGGQEPPKRVHNRESTRTDFVG